jgi:hypothetical protein
VGLCVLVRNQPEGGILVLEFAFGPASHPNHVCVHACSMSCFGFESGKFLQISSHPMKML